MKQCHVRALPVRSDHRLSLSSRSCQHVAIIYYEDKHQLHSVGAIVILLWRGSFCALIQGERSNWGKESLNLCELHVVTVT